MMEEELSSLIQRAKSKAFLYGGQLRSTSSVDIAQGVWPKSSTIEYFWAAQELGLCPERFRTPLGM